MGLGKKQQMAASKKIFIGKPNYKFIKYDK